MSNLIQMQYISQWNGHKYKIYIFAIILIFKIKLVYDHVLSNISQ